MTTKAQRAEHEAILLEVTGLPTAAGHEDRVIDWIRAWVDRRRSLRLTTDRAGNLFIRHVDAAHHDDPPILVTAHLDHPAFVVRRIIDDRTVELEFRGGVHDPYFDGAAVQIMTSTDDTMNGRIVELDADAKPFKRVTVTTTRTTASIRPGDIGGWSFRGRGQTPVIHEDRLHAPACDDLAAVAAALSMLDITRRRKGRSNVGVLFTRAEEIGFIGALAACHLRSIPKASRLICLENSRSYAESPIGGGPILRVGDKMSVFDPRLTNRIGSIMHAHAAKHADVRWQRRLMPGGTCEATAFSAHGYQSTCLCLPLGNYHNMADIDGVATGKRPARVRPEVISVSDYHGLIDMLLVVTERLDDDRVTSIDDRLSALLEKHGSIVGIEHSGTGTQQR